MEEALNSTLHMRHLRCHVNKPYPPARQWPTFSVVRLNKIHYIWYLLISSDICGENLTWNKSDQWRSKPQEQKYGRKLHVPLHNYCYRFDRLSFVRSSIIEALLIHIHNSAGICCLKKINCKMICNLYGEFVHSWQQINSMPQTKTWSFISLESTWGKITLDTFAVM